MFDVNEILRMGEERKKEKGESFIRQIRKDMLNNSEAEVSRMYTRDKNESIYKVCKMKSGNFAVINRDTDNIEFSSENLHETKAEFMVMHSMTSGIGAKIFDKVCNL